MCGLDADQEELEANNEELQVTNEELETANEELSARTAELRETGKSLADERTRLAGMVELAPFDMMILSGSSLIVNAANARAMGFSGGREILGRPFAEIFDQPEMADLVNVVGEAYRRGQIKVTPSMRRQMPDDRRKSVERYFVYTIIPTRDSAEKVDGVAIYIEDVTDQRAMEARERREQLKLMVEHAEHIALGLYDAQN